MTGMRALSLLASFLALWGGTAMLLSRVPWFRDSVSLAERPAPYANIEASWTHEVERWPLLRGGVFCYTFFKGVGQKGSE